jgi:hypothetical protein
MKPNRYQGLMIRPALIFISAASILFLAACGSDDDQTTQHKHKFGYPPDTTTETAPPDQEVPPGPEETANPANTGPIAPTPPPPPPPAPDTTPSPTATGPSGNIPYGTPVAGKAGFVTSPYAPGNGYVDVRGYPPGTEVKDPYTGKVFLVP